MSVSSPPIELSDSVYRTAVEEHPDFLELDSQDVLRSFISEELERVAFFEDVAQSPLDIRPDVADNIGLVRIHSSVGSYDEPFKVEDNARLRQDKPWLAWFDRQRILHAVTLVRKVAEVRSGYTPKLPRNYTAEDIARQREETKQLIAEYGPPLLYTGYPVETQKAEEVLHRPGGIIPPEKAIIIHGNPKNTVGGAKMMQEKMEEHPELLADGSQMAIVTHAPHLDRVLHIMRKYPFLPEGSIPYIAPVSTPEVGRDEFAVMEVRGLLYYVFLQNDASEQVHAHQTLS